MFYRHAAQGLLAEASFVGLLVRIASPFAFLSLRADHKRLFCLLQKAQALREKGRVIAR